MMKGYSTIKDFIKLRGIGLTYREITEKIGVSRPTLVSWNKDFKEEIEEYKKSLFAELYSREIILEADKIVYDANNLCKYGALDKKTDWADQVASRAFKRLSKTLLKEVKDINIVFNKKSLSITEITISFRDTKLKGLEKIDVKVIENSYGF